METLSSFVKKHKVALIIMAISVGLYLLYDYLTANSASNSDNSANDTDAADQAALQDELASLSQGDLGGSTSSPIATSPAVSGTIPSEATTPVSTGTASPSTPVDPTASVPVDTGVGSTGTSSYTGSNAATTVTSGLTPSGSGYTANYAQEQITNAQANQQYGSNTQNADEALYNEVEQGNPAAIAAMNSYNALFTEQDPQQAAVNYAAGTNPYLAMLAQGVGGGLTPAETQLNAAGGNQPIYQYPTSLSGNPAETGSGSETPAGPGGSTSNTLTTAPIPRPSSIGTTLSQTDVNAPSAITAPTGGPGSLLSGTTVRQLTTIFPSPVKSTGTPITPTKTTPAPTPTSPYGGPVPVRAPVTR